MTTLFYMHAHFIKRLKTWPNSWNFLSHNSACFAVSYLKQKIAPKLASYVLLLPHPRQLYFAKFISSSYTYFHVFQTKPLRKSDVQIRCLEHNQFIAITARWGNRHYIGFTTLRLLFVIPHWSHFVLLFISVTWIDYLFNYSHCEMDGFLFMMRERSTKDWETNETTSNNFVVSHKRNRE